MTTIQRELSLIRGLGECPAGYFEENGQCLIQTQNLAQSGNPAGVQWYPGIYGASGGGPIDPAHPSLQVLSPAVRAAILAAGHTIDCKGPTITCQGNVCAEDIPCSIDGGPYSQSAYAINRNPGVALVGGGAKLPLFPNAAPEPSAPPRARTAAGAPAPSGSAVTGHTAGGTPTAQPAPAPGGGHSTPSGPPAGGPVGGPGLMLDPAVIGGFLTSPALGTSFPWWAVLGVVAGGALLMGGRR